MDSSTFPSFKFPGQEKQDVRSSTLQTNKFNNAMAGLFSGVSEAISQTSKSNISVFAKSETSQLADETIKEMAAFRILATELKALKDADLLPGERVLSIEKIMNSSDSLPKDFVRVFDVIISQHHLGISESAKAAFIRFSIDHVDSSSRGTLTKSLLRQLDSSSPVCASAAASALREISDKYLVPALKLKLSEAKWRLVRSELEMAVIESANP